MHSSRDRLLDSDLVCGDETVFQVLNEPGRAAQSKSYLCAQMNGTDPPVRLFNYAPIRSTAHALALYAGSKPGALDGSLTMDATYTNMHPLPLANPRASLAGKTRLCMTIENVPSEESPRTGEIVPPSVLACLKGLVSTLKVGT